jgi:uncharacterized protein (TIGR01244 family)
MELQELYNYRKVSDLISTAGQPTEEQLKAVAAAGFKVVINLATIHPEHSLPDEAGLVRSLGMQYYHLPVDWGNPTQQDFASFEKLVARHAGDKTLIHCAANFRVTAFYSLYAMKQLGWSEAQAEALRMSVWQGSDYPIWEKFIRDMKANLNPG